MYGQKSRTLDYNPFKKSKFIFFGYNEKQFNNTQSMQSLALNSGSIEGLKCIKGNAGLYNFIVVLFQSLFLPKKLKNYLSENSLLDSFTGPIVSRAKFLYTMNLSTELLDLMFFSLKYKEQSTIMFKVTRRKTREIVFSLNCGSGLITFDGKSCKTFSVDDIQDIRIGPDSRNYREQLKVKMDYEDRWFSIIYLVDHKLKILHLIAPTHELRQQWLILLKKIQLYRIEIMGKLGLMGNKSDNWLEKHWELIQKNHSFRLCDIEKLCKKLHVNVSKKYLRDLFNRVDILLTGKLDFTQFQKFVKFLKERQEVNDIFRTYTKSHKHFLNFEEFQSFLINEQRLDNNPDNKEIFKEYSNKHNNLMSIDDFAKFLFSDKNPLIINSNIDMSRPLNEYYISSSHNTYLLGKQFGGESSIEAYIKVLQKGCRCIEIDCWDGPDGPLVYHGRCFTTKILFYDVISTISKYAFIVSPYPLILSLEVHCSFFQQSLMVSILKELLGEMLITSPINKNSQVLPSPMELKYKILLKVKQNPENSLNIFGLDASSSTTTDTTCSSDFDVDHISTEKYKTKSHKKNPGKIIDSLLNLSVYIKGIKFRNFSLPESKTITHIFSLSEKSFNNLIKASRSQLEKHNVKYLMRLYPKFTRINSTNFEPQQYWQKGVQMVALNWQTNDLGIQINDAMFSDNDKYGYILKPLYLRTSDLKHNESSIFGLKKVLLDIKIISAQQLPRTKDFRQDISLNPFVEMKLIMLNNEHKSWKTSTIYDNGYKPIWNETFTVMIDRFQYDFIFLQFNIYNNNSSYSLDNILIATYCLRLSSLLQGYKHIPLNDQYGEKYLFSTLFIHLRREIL